MEQKTIMGVGRFCHHYPKVATIITSQSKGRENAMAVAWHCALSFDPPLYGISISPRRFTYNLILESKEFGVNFLPWEKIELVVRAGAISGKEVNKWEILNIQKERTLKTSVPILKDAYAAYECRLIDHKTYGDHEWFVGEILVTHFKPELFTDKEVLDSNKINPVLYLGSDFYITSAKESLRYLDRQLFKT